MADATSERHPIDRLAEDFVACYRRGEHPSVSEYARRYPEWSEQIAEVLQALVLMEELGPARGSSSRPGGPARTDDQARRQLGEYRILREVGRGGMGVVYEAEQETLGRHVALKVLPSSALVDPTHLARFRREARAAARLHHTHIVPVFGVGEEDGVHYYAMQFIRGQGLDAILREVWRLRMKKSGFPGRDDGPPSAASGLARSLVEGASVEAGGSNGDGPESADTPSGAETASVSLPGQAPDSTVTDSARPYFRSVAQIGLQVAEALAYAHGQGVLHRDVKPSNLMLDTDGHVWVTDFGLAKADGGDSLTHTGDLVGTFRYMAPERFDGWSDPRSDVYSLGLTLYELLTLRPAFEESDRGGLIRSVTQVEPMRPRRLDRRIPHDLETIVLKAIAKEPGQRYASAADLAEDLRRFLADRPIRARRAQWPERAWRWCRRNPAVAALTGCAAALLVTVAVGASLSAFWLRAERDATRDQLRKTARAERLAQQRLFDARLAQARASRWSGQVGQRFKGLEALDEAARLARALGLGPGAALELRDEAIACLALADARLVKSWSGDPPGSDSGIAFDPRLEHYARASPRGDISVRRVADDRELARLPGRGPVAQHLEFSPDGRFLAARYDSPLRGLPDTGRVWDWRRGRVAFAAPLRSWGRFLGFSPDGRLVAVGGDGTVGLHELPSGAEVQRLGVGSWPEAGAFHPDGSRLAVASRNQGDVEVYDRASGRLALKLPHPSAVWDIAWHPDGALLATACGNNVHLWDPKAGAPHAILRGHWTRVVGVVFARGGDAVLSWSYDGSGRLWDPWSGRLLLTTPCSNDYLDVADRGLVQVEPSRLAVWELDLGREYRTIPDLRAVRIEHPGICPISPDGRLLALGGDTGFRLWDLASGAAGVPVGTERTTDVAFHPSGDALLANGRSGLYRWPLRREGDSLRVGPPIKLPMPGSGQRIALDRRGRVLAIADREARARVYDLEASPDQPIGLDHPMAVFVAVSPDGRWVATGAWNGRGVKVWEARGGRAVAELLPEAVIANVGFSPDGRWLVTGTNDEFALWEVGPWRSARRFARAAATAGVGPGGIAFTDDGAMLALEVARTAIELVDPATGRTLARLQSPDDGPVWPVGFAAGGNRLVVRSGPPWRLHVWDLRAIRARLAAMGLDWGPPAIRPAADRPAADAAGPTPLRIVIEPGEPAP